MLNIAICDDNKSFLKEFSNLVDSLVKEDHTIKSFSDPKKLQDFINENTNKIDIVITDIKMPEFNGIQLAKSIKPIHPYIHFIFVTAYVDFIQEVFSVNPVYYITKPVQKDKLEEAISLAKERIEQKKANTIKLKKNNTPLQIPIDEILYVESDKRRIIIHTIYLEENINVKLDELEKELPSYFLRCHKSFLVNMNMIYRISNNKITLFSNKTIPVAKSRYSEVKKAIIKHWGCSL